jgi:hypothetical protein
MESSTCFLEEIHAENHKVPVIERCPKGLLPQIQFHNARFYQSGSDKCIAASPKAGPRVQQRDFEAEWPTEKHKKCCNWQRGKRIRFWRHWFGHSRRSSKEGGKADSFEGLKFSSVGQ